MRCVLPAELTCDGPYDELIWLSGRVADPAGRSGFSIERIFVSTAASTANGRRNWCVVDPRPRLTGQVDPESVAQRDSADEPEYVAEFTFEPADPGDEPFSVSLRLPGISQPFFAARVHPPWLAPTLGLPVTTDVLLGAFSLVQPALKTGEGPLLGSKDPWCTVTPTLRGNVRLATIEPLLQREGDKAYGDGVDWPNIWPLPLGFTIRDCSIHFPAACVTRLPGQALTCAASVRRSRVGRVSMHVL